MLEGLGSVARLVIWAHFRLPGLLGKTCSMVSLPTLDIPVESEFMGVGSAPMRRFRLSVVTVYDIELVD